MDKVSNPSLQVLGKDVPWARMVLGKDSHPSQACKVLGKDSHPIRPR